MSSDVGAATLSVQIMWRQKNKNTQKYWVHPYSKGNLPLSIFISCTGEDPVKFQTF